MKVYCINDRLCGAKRFFTQGKLYPIIEKTVRKGYKIMVLRDDDNVKHTLIGEICDRHFIYEQDMPGYKPQPTVPGVYF